MPKEYLVDYDPKTGGWVSPPIRRTHGYCVHKTTQKRTGTITKMELFAFFEGDMLPVVQERANDLQKAKAGTYPPFLDHKGKHITLFQAVVCWNGAPMGIRCYRQGRSGPFKLEVVKGRMKGHGRKFLAPVSTLNSLGALMRFLTNDAAPVRGHSHDDFHFIDEFLNECASLFKMRGLRGQLRLMAEQRLRADLRFAFSSKGNKRK